MSAPQIEAKMGKLKKRQYTMSYLNNLNIMYWRRQWQPTPVLLPGKSHEWRSLVGCSPWGRGESDTTERLHFHFSLSCIGEGNGSPTQCSCLENPRDGGAWWAAFYGVTQSQTRLKWLSSSSSSRGTTALIWLKWSSPKSRVSSETGWVEIQWYLGTESKVRLDHRWSWDRSGNWALLWKRLSDWTFWVFSSCAVWWGHWLFLRSSHFIILASPFPLTKVLTRREKYYVF